MLITKQSSITGKTHTRDIPITADQLNVLGVSPLPIQQILPNLSADDREFLMTGITPEEWGEFIKE